MPRFFVPRRVRPLPPLFGGIQSLVNISNNVVNMLDTDRQANQIVSYSGTRQFFRRQLAVGRTGRMAGQRLRIADVHESGDELQRINELGRCCRTPFDAETHYP